MVNFTSQGLVSDHEISGAFQSICDMLGIKAFELDDATLDVSDAFCSNQMRVSICAYIGHISQEAGLDASLPFLLSADDGALTGYSLDLTLKDSDYPPSMLLTLLDYAACKSQELSAYPGVGNLTALMQSITKSDSPEYSPGPNN